MRHSQKSVSLQKNVSKIEKCFKFRKMCHHLNNASHLEKIESQWQKCDSYKMRHSQKYAAQLEKFVTVRKVCHCQKNVSQLEKCVSVSKVGDREMCHGKFFYSQKNVSQLEKCVRVKTMWHSQKNVSLLEKCVTDRKMRHSFNSVSHIVSQLKNVSQENGSVRKMRRS